MTLDTFFKKFDQFADAPDAVAKMRELVLELAVQGKLVDQKKSDGNALQLLAEISSERDARAALLRTPKKPESAYKGEHAFPIPATWLWTQLGNIALQIQYGYTASADHTTTDVRMLRITDIQNNRVNWPTVPGCQITKGEADKYLLVPNDILIARTGGTIGKSFIIPDAPVRSVFASYLIRVTPPSAMEARFLKIFLETPLYWKQLQAMSAGTGQPNVNGQALGRLELPLPPLAEQKRIVAKVDELMALCDRLEAQQQERDEQASALARASLARFAEAPTPANLNLLFNTSYSIPPADLRRAILTLAVQGKLVPQDPKDADARNTIDRAMANRQKMIQSKNLRRKELAETATLFRREDLPTSWCVERFANLVDPENTISYGVLVPGNDVPDGIPFVRAQDLCLANHPARPNKTISPEIEKPYARTRLTGGEILLGVVGSIGKLGTVPDTWAGANIARAVARIKPIAELLPAYLLLVLQENTVQTYFTSTTRTLAQPTLNVGMIEQTSIPVPPLAEQRRIVAKVDQLMALVDQLETQLAASRATAKNLLDALIGELT